MSSAHLDNPIEIMLYVLEDEITTSLQTEPNHYNNHIGHMLGDTRIAMVKPTTRGNTILARKLSSSKVLNPTPNFLCLTTLVKNMLCNFIH